MKFKVKRHWWMWALGILGHIIATRFFQIGIYPVLIVVLIIDFIFIFPEAFHFSYDIINRQLTVKRVIYSDISFPVSEITAVENATLLTMMGGFGLQIYSESFGTYKITYSKNDGSRRRTAVLVCPKNRQEFIRELSLHVDRKVILINNTESAFKKKKDEM